MESDINFILNNQEIHAKINPATVLLDYIRKVQKLSGTKEVCKEGDCGACAVLLGDLTEAGIKYKTINSCLFPIQNVHGKHVVTIEGLNQENLNPIQSEFLTQGASQCGFCTPGFIISLTGYLINSNKSDYNDAVNSVGGNICRCTGYNSIKKSIKNILLELNRLNISNNNLLDVLIKNKILPNYFKNIEEKLKKINLESNGHSHFQKQEAQIFIGGGTDLFVQKPDELLSNDINFYFKIPKPKISQNDNEILIHSSTTMEELKEYFEKNIPKFNFENLFNLFASKPIRNSATIAGNIINASPIADITITLLALNAELILIDLNDKKRKIKLDQFYRGYKTLDINPNEVIESISIPLPKPNSFFNFEKVSKRTHLDIASVNSAMLLEVKKNKIVGARISAGGVSPIPLFLVKASGLIISKEISNDIINQISETAKSEISPISDIRGSREYKTLLLGQLIKAHFIELFPQKINHEVLV